MSAILDELKTYARLIAKKYDLKFKKIKLINVSKRYEGWCTADGYIGIAVIDPDVDEYFDHDRIIDTLCHEMAHLKHHNHGDNWKALFKQILRYCRKIDTAKKEKAA